MNKCGVDSFLSRDDTKILKGIAIILMLMHHLWAFPERLPGDAFYHLFSIDGISSIQIFGQFGKMCVSMFMFLGGYGMYIEHYNKRFSLIKKLKKLYLAYWKVFVIFVPIAFLFFSQNTRLFDSTYGCERYNMFDVSETILNFMGVSSSFNDEWWFLYSYAIAIFSFPLVRKIVERHSLPVNLFLVIVASVVNTNVLRTLGENELLGTVNGNYLYSTLICQVAPHISSFWMGVVAAKNGLLDRLSYELKDNKMLNPFVDCLVIFGVFFLRQFETGSTFDIFYVAIISVVSLDLLSYLKLIRKVLFRLGNESTNMWLIHSFLCYYFYPFAKLLVNMRWGLLALLLFVIMCFVMSICVTLFWKSIGKFYMFVKTHRG